MVHWNPGINVRMVYQHWMCTAHPCLLRELPCAFFDAASRLRFLMNRSVSASAIDGHHWKRQRVIIRNQNRLEPLSDLTIDTGLTAPPTKPWPSRWAARSSSLVFHPTEMLYALGQPNGAGEFDWSWLSITY
jgi:hypothetical protein